MAQDPNSASGSGTAREEALVKVPSKDPKKKDEKKDEDLVSSMLFGSWENLGRGKKYEIFMLYGV